MCFSDAILGSAQGNVKVELKWSFQFSHYCKTEFDTRGVELQFLPSSNTNLTLMDLDENMTTSESQLGPKSRYWTQFGHILAIFPQSLVFSQIARWGLRSSCQPLSLRCDGAKANIDMKHWSSGGGGGTTQLSFSLMPFKLHGNP